MRVREHVPLRGRTSFRIGGRARLFVEPRTLEELEEALAAIHRWGIPFFVLGGGTNTLMPDDEYPGCVISTRGLRGIEDRGDRRFAVLGGTHFFRVIRHTIECGCAGLERLVGIPGSVGGAVYGNAGAADHAIGKLVESVLFFEPGRPPLRIPGCDLAWRYRASGLGDGGRRGVVGEVVLGLEEGDAEALAASARSALQRKRDTQPLADASAGCVFRNPSFAPAGQLIESVGLKGESVGAARVSRRHANFIVNEGGAQAREVCELLDRIRSRVRDRYGVLLTPEIVCLEREPA